MACNIIWSSKEVNINKNDTKQTVIFLVIEIYVTLDRAGIEDKFKKGKGISILEISKRRNKWRIIN